jgi:hypothetical protein
MERDTEENGDGRSYLGIFLENHVIVAAPPELDKRTSGIDIDKCTINV